MCETGKSFIPVAEAAHLLKTTEMRVLMMLKKNELAGKLEGETWFLDKASLLLCGKPKPSDLVRPGGCGGGCSSGCISHKEG